LMVQRQDMVRLGGAVTVFAVNTAYLSAFADASLFYFVNVVFHIALGAVLALVFGRRLAGNWRRMHPALLVAAGVLAAGALTGAAIVVFGAAGPFRWLLPTHIAL